MEGTELYVLELVMFGAAYSSYYLLLRSKDILSRLGEDEVRSALVQAPARFGRHLTFGRDLARDSESGAVSYIGPVRPPTPP